MNQTVCVDFLGFGDSWLCLPSQCNIISWWCNSFIF